MSCGFRSRLYASVEIAVTSAPVLSLRPNCLPFSSTVVKHADVQSVATAPRKAESGGFFSHDFKELVTNTL